MVFCCQVCSKPLTGIQDIDTSDVVTTSCGHLFHEKCFLDISIYNRKLSHAKQTGPVKRHCPGFNCARELPENGVFKLACNEAKATIASFDEDEQEENYNIELLLSKKVSTLTSENELFAEKIEKLEKEILNLQDTMSEIRDESDEVLSLFENDKNIKQGDHVFWSLKNGTFLPARILDVILKSSSTGETNNSFAVLKFDGKVKIKQLGKIERESAIVPLEELITFKSFFKDFFIDFRRRLWKLLWEFHQTPCDTSDKMQGPPYSSFNERRESSINGSQRSNTSLSKSCETSDQSQIDEECLNDEAGDVLGEANWKDGRSSDRRLVKRSKSVQIVRGRKSSVMEQLRKARSSSMHSRSPSKSDYSNHTWAMFTKNQFKPVDSTPKFESRKPERKTSALNFMPNSVAVEHESNYINLGERVIFYEKGTTNPQVGVVVSLLNHTPCAIVKFDEIPNEEQMFRCRTTPYQQLFPYALASVEEKMKIAAIYGTLDDFMADHGDTLSEQYAKDVSDPGTEHEEDNEEFFSTSSTENVADIDC